jgi:hypothetical protein
MAADQKPQAYHQVQSQEMGMELQEGMVHEVDGYHNRRPAGFNVDGNPGSNYPQAGPGS